MTLRSDKQTEFQLANDLIYLNHAGVAPWPSRTITAINEFAIQNGIYGATFYPDWLKKETALRHQLRVLLNASSIDDIALVKNTSEALSFVAYGLQWQTGDNIVTSNEEFPSNRLPWQSLSNQGVELRQADLSSEPEPEEALFALIDDRTRLLTISSIQFASGLRLDLNKIGRYCRRYGILFCIDGIQSLGAIQFDVQSCYADFVMADGHKWMLGPEGLGVFYTTSESRAKLELTQYGWHMVKDIHNYKNKPWEIHPSAQRFECGSPNMLGIHALSASLSLLLETGMANVEQKVVSNTAFIMDKIIQSDHLKLLSNANARLLSGIVIFRHRTVPNKILFKHLQSNGVICALRGLGIRFSAHFYNTEAELNRAILIAESCQ